MRRQLTTAVLACVLVLGAVAAAREEAAQPAAGPAALLLPAPPAPQYVIQEVQVRAAPEAGALQGTMTVGARCLADGRTWVPLFKGNVGVLSATATGGGWFGPPPMPMRKGEAVGLLLPGEGEFELELEFATPVKRERQTSSALVPMVAALSGVYEVTLEGENLVVVLEPDVPYQKQVHAGRTVVSIYGTLEEPLQLRWTPGPEVREVETIAFAEQRTLMDISPGLLRVSTDIEYALLQGRMEEALVELPDGYSLLKVEGDNLRSWDIRRAEEGPDLLAVKPIEPDAASSRLTLVLERTLEPVPVEVEAPQILVRGVTREKGALAVAVEKGLQAEIIARENIGQVNLQEMPRQMQALGDRFSLGLKYLTRPFSVTFRVSTIEPRVYGEIACLTVASLERFRQHWDVQYEIRNAGLFQLKLRLAEGMKLISLRGANINNQSLDPATNVLTVDLRSKAEGRYALSLQTHSPVSDPATAAVPALELLGVERQWGTLALSADSGIAVEPGELEGISQIEAAEVKAMPTVLQMVADQQAAEPSLAFRYLSFPYTLAVAVSHVQPELKCEPLHMVQITRKNLRYYSAFNYRIKKAGVFQLRIHLPEELRGSLVVNGKRVEDYSYDAASQTLTVQLTEKTTDELTVELESETLLGKELPKPGETDVFPIPAVYTLDCEQERGHVALATEESVRLKRSGEGGPLHDVDVQEIPPALLQRARDAKLAFRIIESPWELNLEVTSIPPKITATTFNYVRFGEDYLLGASTVEFDIQQAGVSEFRVRLPEGVTDPSIRGENIKIQEKVEEEEPEGGELWRVELQSEVRGAYQLIFEYTMDLDPKAKLRAFAGPQVMGEMKGVEREIGYLAVTGDPSLELAPVEAELEGLTPVDEEEIPVKFRRLPPSVAEQIGRQTVPILFAFRYLAHPYRLTLSSVRHAEADVVTAVVESCRLDTTLTREGNRITSLVASVRSRYQPFLEIRLPEGARLWHALVNGRRARPFTEAAADGGPEITKIPIAQVQGIEGAVKVELQWEEMGGARLGRFERVHLRVPSLMGVRILRLGWTLQLPRGYRMVSSSGTLEALPSESYFEDALGALRATERPAGAAGVQQVEGASAEDFQAASNIAVLTGRAAGKQAARPAAVYAGSKPQLPGRFHFQGLILNPEVPAEVTATCVASSAMTPLTAVVVLAVLGLCALLWYRSGLPAHRSFIALAAVALVVAGVRVIAEEDYSDLLLAVLCTVGASAVLFAALSIIGRVQARELAAPPEE
jgi:hypothetical protein